MSLKVSHFVEKRIIIQVHAASRHHQYHLLPPKGHFVQVEWSNLRGGCFVFLSSPHSLSNLYQTRYPQRLLQGSKNEAYKITLPFSCDLCIQSMGLNSISISSSLFFQLLVSYICYCFFAMSLTNIYFLPPFLIHILIFHMYPKL